MTNKWVTVADFTDRFKTDTLLQEMKVKYSGTRFRVIEVLYEEKDE